MVFNPSVLSVVESEGQRTRCVQLFGVMAPTQSAIGLSIFTSDISAIGDYILNDTLTLAHTSYLRSSRLLLEYYKVIDFACIYLYSWQ